MQPPAIRMTPQGFEPRIDRRPVIRSRTDLLFLTYSLFLRSADAPILPGKQKSISERTHKPLVKTFTWIPRRDVRGDILQEQQGPANGECQPPQILHGIPSFGPADLPLL